MDALVADISNATAPQLSVIGAVGSAFVGPVTSEVGGTSARTTSAVFEVVLAVFEGEVTFRRL